MAFETCLQCGAPCAPGESFCEDECEWEYDREYLEAERSEDE